MFDLFDYPYSVKIIKITEGYTSQEDGTWIPASSTEEEIEGHVAGISLEELSRTEGSILGVGDRKLIADKDYGINTGDEIQIYEDAAGATITKWQVAEIQKFKNVIKKYVGEKRMTIYLKRKI